MLAPDWSQDQLQPDPGGDDQEAAGEGGHGGGHGPGPGCWGQGARAGDGEPRHSRGQLQGGILDNANEEDSCTSVSPGRCG